MIFSRKSGRPFFRIMLRPQGRLSWRAPTSSCLGAGIVGTSIAVHLAKRGLAVALVDRSGPGEGDLLRQRHGDSMPGQCRPTAGPAQLPNTRVDQRSGSSGSHAGRAARGRRFRRRGSAFLKGGEGPRRKVVRPALDDVYDSLDLARRKLNHDLVGLPVPGDEVESRRGRFGHAMLGAHSVQTRLSAIPKGFAMAPIYPGDGVRASRGARGRRPGWKCSMVFVRLGGCCGACARGPRRGV
jgi:hypothetical protein